ncbi:uncharacterized protein LOC128951293 [Oppia nitens]|uniref:uncharacterized protein LOC128951293 n=1 Tax=Oppia nitens TaxID=1686743 RepID=UPI0023DA28E6|nr:uncharacterized protein LOC128951293 [Oppia nitens]
MHYSNTSPVNDGPSVSLILSANAVHHTDHYYKIGDTIDLKMEYDIPEPFSLSRSAWYKDDKTDEQFLEYSSQKSYKVTNIPGISDMKFVSNENNVIYFQIHNATEQTAGSYQVWVFYGDNGWRHYFRPTNTVNLIVDK